MANVVNKDFHSKLRSVVDILAVTAVKEISKLVDDGFAMLHLKVSLSQKENQALRCQIQTMEHQIARGCVEASEMREQLAKCRCRDVQSDGNPYKTTQDIFAERMDVSKMDAELHSVRENSPAPPADMRAEGTDMEEGRTVSVQMKKERAEEDRHPQRERNSREQIKVTVNHTEDRGADWEVSGLESALKTEPETESGETLQHTGCEQSAGRLHSSCPEYLMCDRTSQLRTLCPQGAGETEAAVPSCSYATESSSESLSIHSGLQSLPPTGKGAGSSLSLGSLDVKPEAVMIDSAPAEEEAEMHSAWNEETISENAPALHRHYSEERPFTCQQCGKGFVHLSHLTIHRRVHTGEKPYRCTLCQLQFSRSSNLNRHYKVHTGEKPFRCSFCGRRFSESGNLKKHQRIHSGDQPYRCLSCGRMFTSQQNLQRHQQRVHAVVFNVS